MYQAPRGMRDLLPDEAARWQHVESQMRAISRRYGYRELEPPVLEHTEVFARGLGEDTDIVEKELYSFGDRGGRSLTLRPEFTAGVVRAYLEHGMRTWPQPVKLFSFGPIFRYDRPQAGRYRQHSQWNAEVIGSPDPAADVEVTSMAVRLLQALGLREVEVRLNSVGDRATRPAYVEALREFYRPRLAELDEDGRRRFETNPLRILDSKDERTREVSRDAPEIFPYLTDRQRVHFDRALALFKGLGIRVVVDKFIVRGQDYYTDTAVEVYSGKLGAQNTMFGGGRYDGLAEQLGGPATPGVGFGLGIERLMIVLEEEGVAPPAQGGRPDVFVAAAGGAAFDAAFVLLDRLRAAGLSVELDLNRRNLGGQLRHADRLGARLALILGDVELARGQAIVRDMTSGTQEDVPMERVIEYLAARASG